MKHPSKNNQDENNSKIINDNKQTNMIFIFDHPCKWIINFRCDTFGNNEQSISLV